MNGKELASANLLHGVKLETIITDLVDHFGREKLALLIKINCFRANPSIKSSLIFLRKTERARKEVEELYLEGVADGFLTDKSTPVERPAPVESVTGKE